MRGARSCPPQAGPPPTGPPQIGDRIDDGERGTVTPMILLFFLVAALLVMGASAAGSAFLSQRDLQARCDSAALAGADALAPTPLYKGGGSGLERGIPLAGGGVDAAVARVNGSSGGADRPVATMSASTDGHSVSIQCRDVAHIPFGAAFGHASGLVRSARSTARAPATAN